jgi:hypothetical protein
MPFEELSDEEYINSLLGTEGFGFTPVGDEDVLLQTIVDAEAGGNYNAFSGNGNNYKYDLTSMTLGQVFQFQDYMVNELGTESSAVGGIQIIKSTLASAAQEMGLSENTVFNVETQNAIGTHLLRRRGYDQFLEGSLPHKDFANNLAKEWAALPLTTGERRGESYYRGVGSNNARIAPVEILSSLYMIRE